MSFFESEIVQEEAKQLFTDYQNLMQLGSGYGKFDREGKVMFSSNLANELIIFTYISDGLAADGDMRISKMAEEAMYMHMLHAVLSTKANIPEYIVRRYKIERRAALRNAKIRLSNIKLQEFVQVMRGKSKWIKH